MLHAVIMAGGTGTRFWPRSTRDKPKQFLNIFGDQTMLQATAHRIAPLIPAERTWVITNDSYVNLVKNQLPEVPEENIIGEPVAKNTAPCVAAAAALIAQKDPEGTMVVLPADHLITKENKFLSTLKTSAQSARKRNALVTIGIQPTHPETGYGYIEFERSSAKPQTSDGVKKVRQFREKPDFSTAKAFLAAGNFLWNSGMFVWGIPTIIDQFQKHLPKIHNEIEKLTSDTPSAIENFYRACPSVSIDYGIMEHAENVLVVPGDIGWSDVGSWRAVYDIEEKDDKDNVINAKWSAVSESSNNLIYSKSDKMIALVGVNNVAVVETDKAILVCSLDDAQGVKKIVQSLKADEGTKKFL